MKEEFFIFQIDFVPFGSIPVLESAHNCFLQLTVFQHVTTHERPHKSLGGVFTLPPFKVTTLRLLLVGAVILIMFNTIYSQQNLPFHKKSGGNLKQSPTR